MQAIKTYIPSDDENLSVDDLVPLEQFVEAHPQVWKTLSSARWTVHNAARNGAQEYGVFCKRGRRILVIKPRLAKWLAAGTLDKRG